MLVFKTIKVFNLISNLLLMQNLTINTDKAKEVAIILFEKFNFGEGIFGHKTMPEDVIPETAKWGSPIPSIESTYEHLMFITLVVSIDYQRDANQLWEAGRKTFEDDETKWLFYPSQLIKKSAEDIIKSMKKHKLSKKHTQDANIWRRVSTSFLEQYDSDPLNLIKECYHDAMKIYNKKFDLRFKTSFPFLSGNKIFPLWIRMLHDNIGIKLKNMDKIPIPVDVHIARATFTTGCLNGDYEGSISDVFPKIDDAWEKTIQKVNHPKLSYRAQLDEPLWHLSKYGCRFRKGNTCPNRSVCPVKTFCVDGIVKVSAKRVLIKTGLKSNEKTSVDNFLFTKKE
jgi:hypothetical protein